MTELMLHPVGLPSGLTGTPRVILRFRYNTRYSGGTVGSAALYEFEWNYTSQRYEAPDHAWAAIPGVPNGGEWQGSPVVCTVVVIPEDGLPSPDSFHIYPIPTNPPSNTLININDPTIRTDGFFLVRKSVYQTILDARDQAVAASQRVGDFLATAHSATVTASDPEGEWVEVTFTGNPGAANPIYTQLATDLAALEVTLTGVANDVSTLAGTVDPFEARVTSAEGKITALQGNLDGITEAITTLGAPVGDIRLWPSSDLPEKWLPCDGRSLLRAEYPALFDVLLTTFGATDSTHFNLPDFRGRTALGAGNGPALTNRTLGVKDGAETVVLTMAQLPEQGVAFKDGYFSENPTDAPTSGITTRPAPQNKGLQGPVDRDNVIWEQQSTTEPLGNGEGHDNMMPFLTVHFIIRVLP